MTIKRLAEEPSEYPPMTPMLKRVLALVEAVRGVVRQSEDSGDGPMYVDKRAWAQMLAALAAMKEAGDID